ncbi:MAG: RNA polymerase sigma factor [Limisphaerales bacterium]
MTDQATLLQRYVRNGDEDAFTDLVKQHLNLVWGAARRITGDGDRARDVAQTVFADLARKAAGLPLNVVLEGWLYRAACLAAANVVRGDARRNQRERQAMELHSSADSTVPDPRQAEALQPWLDEALGELEEADRQAVVLRFLAGRSFAEIGATLGLSADTAQKRVSRALARLREQFQRRGISTTEGALGFALAVAGSQMAPGGLAASLTVGALAGLETAGWIQTLTMMKAKLALAGAAIALVVTPLTLQHLELKRMSEENRTLREQAARTAALEAENERLARLKLDVDELELLRGEHLELMRLRGEIGRLRHNPPAEISESPKPAVEADVAPTPSRMLLAPMKARVRDGETLLTGGWTTADGRRGVMMVSPRIGTDASDSESQITITFTLLEGLESAFAEAGLGDLRGDEGGAAVHRSMGAAAAEALLRQLAATGEVDLLAAPRVSALDGRQAQITTGSGDGMTTSIDVIPKMDGGDDGAGVEMTLFVTQTPSQPSGLAPAVMPLPFFTPAPSQGEGGGVVLPGLPEPGEPQ